MRDTSQHDPIYNWEMLTNALEHLVMKTNIKNLH